MEIVLSARNLRKSYVMPHKRVDVLVDTSLDVRAGERVALLGRSGAGKSTLLHVLGGLDHPDRGSGEVLLEGRDLYGLSAARRAQVRARHIGFVFQSYHLLPEMDIVENVLLPAYAVGRISREARKRAVSLLEHMGLGDRLRHMPLELSGGEQQRVALARALMNDPGLILADEPTGNLDETTGRQVLELLFGVSDRQALVVVTHSPEIASRCDRALRLVQGRLEAF